MVRTTPGMLCTKGFVSQAEKSSSDSHVKTTKSGGLTGNGEEGRQRQPVVLGATMFLCEIILFTSGNGFTCLGTRKEICAEGKIYQTTNKKTRCF